VKAYPAALAAGELTSPDGAGFSPRLMNLVIAVLFKNPSLNLIGSPAMMEASQRLTASSKVAKARMSWRCFSEKE
jgi:hypothetical protein